MTENTFHFLVRTVRTNLSTRPLWMNAIMLFCAYMAFIYVPWDLFFKAVEKDQEVWFGIVLTGWAAKATEPLHWLVYGFGAYGFWHMKSWIWPWGSVYLVQVAISMLVWSILDARGGGWIGGSIAAAPFLALAVALWFKRASFTG